jgi:hypothetical protein
MLIFEVKEGLRDVVSRLRGRKRAGELETSGTG